MKPVQRGHLCIDADTGRRIALSNCNGGGIAAPRRTWGRSTPLNVSYRNADGSDDPIDSEVADTAKDAVADAKKAGTDVVGKVTSFEQKYFASPVAQAAIFGLAVFGAYSVAMKILK